MLTIVDPPGDVRHGGRRSRWAGRRAGSPGVPPARREGPRLRASPGPPTPGRHRASPETPHDRFHRPDRSRPRRPGRRAPRGRARERRRPAATAAARGRRGARARRAPCRTSTWPARTASAPRGTAPRRSGSPSPNGVLSDVYYPTIDNTNVETLQYVVTDGSTFTDLQTRDMTYTGQRSRRLRHVLPGHQRPTRSGRYTLVTDYFTDPQRASVVMRTTLKAAKRNAQYCSSTSGSTARSTATAAAARDGQNGGADNAVIDTTHRLPVPVSIDTDDRDQRGEPRLRHSRSTPRCAPTGRSSPPPADSPAPPATGWPSWTPTTRLGHDLRDRDQRQRRADRAARRPRAAARSTLALGFGSHAGRARWPPPARSANAEFAGRSTATTARLGGATTSGLEPAAASPPACPRRSAATLAPHLLPVGERAQGQRGQDVPGRRSSPSLASPWGQAVAPATRRRRTSAPTARSSPATCTRRSPGCVASGDVATAKDTVRFLFERQQQPDGSMPRNSLVNGKTRAGLVRRAARRGRLPDPDGPHRRADRQGVLHRPHQARRGLRRRPRPGVRQRALGGAERATRPRRSPPRSPASPPPGAIAEQNGDAAGRADLPRHRRPLPAEHQELDGHDERPAQPAAVLHPAVQERRPERGDHATTSATAAPTPTSGPSSTRASSSCPGSASCRPTTPTSPRSLAARRQRDRGDDQQRARLLPLRHRHARHRGRLRRLQRRRPDRLHGRRASRGPASAAPRARTRAPATSGRCWPASAAEHEIATGTPADGRRSCWAAMAATASGIGLIPEQAWENAGPGRRRRSAPHPSARRSASRTARRPAAPRR